MSKKISNKCILPILNFKNGKGTCFLIFFCISIPKIRLTIKCNTIYAVSYFNTVFFKKEFDAAFRRFFKKFYEKFCLILKNIFIYNVLVYFTKTRYYMYNILYSINRYKII